MYGSRTLLIFSTPLANKRIITAGLSLPVQVLLTKKLTFALGSIDVLGVVVGVGVGVATAGVLPGVDVVVVSVAVEPGVDVSIALTE